MELKEVFIRGGSTQKTLKNSGGNSKSPHIKVRSISSQSNKDETTGKTVGVWGTRKI